MNNENTNTNPKSKSRKLKLFSIGAASIACLVIIAIFLFNLIRGPVLNKTKLKELFCQYSITYHDKQYKITPENIESLKIVSRKTKRKKTDTVDCKITLDFDSAKVTSYLNLSFLYSKEDEEWILAGVDSPREMDIEPQTDLKSNIETLIKNSSSKNISSSINFDEVNIESISDVSITDKENYYKNVTAKVTISNNFVKSTVSINFDTTFNLVSGEWSITSRSIDCETIGKETLNKDLTDEEKENIILSSLSKGSYDYKYGDNQTESFRLNGSIITDLKITSFDVSDENIVKAEIEGQAKSGPINDMKFSGTVYSDLSISSKSKSANEITFDSLAVDELTIDDLKKVLLEYDIDHTQITPEISETVKIEREIALKDMFSKIYIFTIDVNGTTKRMQARMSLNYDNINYNWCIQLMMPLS